jgi:hypothetical protein
MSAYKTVTLERTGDGLIEFSPAVLKWDPASYPANMQVSVGGLNGGTYDLYIIPAGDNDYRLVYEGLTDADLAMLAGKDAPLFHTVLLNVGGTSGSNITAKLTLWERGI